MLNENLLQENIISLLGLQTLSDKQKFTITAKMSDLIRQRISLRVLDELNDTEKKVFIDASNGNDEWKIKEVLNRKKINIFVWVKEEMNRLKEEMKEIIDKIQA